MKKTRKSWAILPLDSATSNSVSKYAHNTYGLHEKRGLKVLRISLLIAASVEMA